MKFVPMQARSKYDMSEIENVLSNDIYINIKSDNQSEASNDESANYIYDV